MILIIGANGFFGNQLQKLFLKKKIKFFPSDISLKNESYLDIRDLVLVFSDIFFAIFLLPVENSSISK